MRRERRDLVAPSRERIRSDLPYDWTKAADRGQSAARSVTESGERFAQRLCQTC